MQNYLEYDDYFDKEAKKAERIRKIKKYAGTIFFTGALLSGGIVLKHSKVDHTQDFCFLNSIFGIEHQIEEINNSKLNDNITAKIVPNSFYQQPEEVGSDVLINDQEKEVIAVYKNGHLEYYISNSYDDPLSLEESKEKDSNLVLTKNKK